MYQTLDYEEGEAIMDIYAHIHNNKNGEFYGKWVDEVYKTAEEYVFFGNKSLAEQFLKDNSIWIKKIFLALLTMAPQFGKYPYVYSICKCGRIVHIEIDGYFNHKECLEFCNFCSILNVEN